MATENITAKLESLRGSLRRLILGVGCFRIMLVVQATIAAAFILDWYAHLPPATRISTAVAVVGISLAAIYQYIIRPMGVPLTDDSLALLVERRHAEFNDRLITAVQLSRERGAGGAAALNSPALVERIVKDAGDVACSTDFRCVLSTTILKRLAVAAAVCSVVVAAYAASHSDLVGIFARRMIAPYSDTQWPRKTTITLPNTDRTITVAKGDDLMIDARCEKHVPSRVTLHYRFASSEKRSRRMKKVSDTDFRANISSITENMSFYIEGGDHTTEAYHVKVTDRPRVETINVSYVYPAYTKKPPFTQPSGLGDIRGVVGTRVSISARTNKPIRHDGAKIVFEDESEQPLACEPGAEGEGSILTGEIELKPGAQTYRIEVTGLDGLSDTNPVTYRLWAIVDKPPVVAVTEPKGNREVTAMASLAVEAKSTDERDLGGIRVTRFIMQSGDDGPRISENFTDTRPGSIEVVSSGSWEIARLAPAEGDVVSCWVEAEDYNDVSGPGIGRSDAFHLTIVSPAQLAAKIDAKLEEIKKSVENIRTREDQIKQTSDGLIERLRADEKLAGEQARQLAAAADVQKDLARNSLGAAAAFAEITQDMQQNKIGTTDDIERMKSFQADMQKLAEKGMPSAAAKLAQAREEGIAPLQDASVMQSDILDELDSVLKRLSKTEDLDELIRQAGRLVLKQKSINDRSRSVGIRTLGQTAAEMADEDKAIIGSLHRDQLGAQEEMKSLESGMSRFIAKSAENDPAASEAVQKAFDEAARDQIRKGMTDVADKLDQLSPASATAIQEKVYNDLQKLVANLNEAKRKQYADTQQLRREMRNAAAKLEKLIREQQANRNRTDPGRAAAIEAALQKLDSMIEQQQAINDATQNEGANQQPNAELAERQQKAAEQAAKLADEVEKLNKQAGEEAGKAAESMQEAQETLQKNPPGKARSAQETALNRLKMAREQLQKTADQEAAERLAMDQDRIARETGEMVAQLANMAEQSRSVDKDISEQVSKASSNTSQARQNMGEAKEHLASEERADAATEQEKAIEKLEEAKQQLSEAQEELERREREKKLFEIGKVLAEMLGRQRTVNVETEQIDEIARKEKNLSRPLLVKLQATAEKQSALKTDAAEMLAKLETENSVVFSYAMSDVVRDMTDAAERLGGQKTGWETQQIQKDIERTLAELVESLKQEYDKTRQGGQQGGGQGGGQQGGDPPLVPPLAQLKLLRTLEVGIFETSKEYDQDKAISRLNPVLLKKRIERLGEKQENVSGITRKFAEELDKAQEAQE